MNKSENGKASLFRQLPGIDALLLSPAAGPLLADYGRALTTEALRAALDNQRQAISAGQLQVPPTEAALLEAAHAWLRALLAPTLFPVINASGVIVHTNLGRAPLSAAALHAVGDIGGSYSTLEYDIAAGQRGSRSTHAATQLQRITGAEAAMVVNNNAAAVLLLLSALCYGREVIISRGQLVEIGGGFRIPDVLAQSGAHLVEVGTTNRTHLADYERAIGPDTAAIFVAHHSNYKIIGFTSEPDLAELAELAHANNLPLFYDQGSGALLDVAPYGLEPEPTVGTALAAGADVVAFSGDKLLGGPQAGLLVGREWAVARMQRHPLARAVRADKLALAALSATLDHYLRQEAPAQVPVWQMISRPLVEIEAEAQAWAAQLAERGIAAEVIDGRSRAGGGSLPGTSLPTKLLALDVVDADRFCARLRLAASPVISRIQDGRVLFDPRTVLPGQAGRMLDTIQATWTEK